MRRNSSANIWPWRSSVWPAPLEEIRFHAVSSHYSDISGKVDLARPCNEKAGQKLAEALLTDLSAAHQADGAEREFKDKAAVVRLERGSR